MRARLSFALLLVPLLSSLGCGGGLAETRADPTARETDELRARDWHTRAVRLEGDALAAEERGEPCPTRCTLATRTCELTDQICRLSDADDNDEGTRVLCEDARPRCDRARSAASSCGC